MPNTMSVENGFGFNEVPASEDTIKRGQNPSKNLLKTRNNVFQNVHWFEMFQNVWKYLVMGGNG